MNSLYEAAPGGSKNRVPVPPPVILTISLVIKQFGSVPSSDEKADQWLEVNRLCVMGRAEEIDRSAKHLVSPHIAGMRRAAIYLTARLSPQETDWPSLQHMARLFRISPKAVNDIVEEVWGICQSASRDPQEMKLREAIAQVVRANPRLFPAPDMAVPPEPLVLADSRSGRAAAEKSDLPDIRAIEKMEIPDDAAPASGEDDGPYLPPLDKAAPVADLPRVKANPAFAEALASKNIENFEDVRAACPEIPERLWIFLHGFEPIMRHAGSRISDVAERFANRFECTVEDLFSGEIERIGERLSPRPHTPACAPS